MAVLVFANGDFDGGQWVRSTLETATAIIAADGGARHVLSLGEQPDVVIGDLDSLPAATREDLQAAGTLILEHAAQKDETDLELALTYAAANYEEEVRVFAGLGGRVDQMLANVLLLAHPALKNRPIRFQTEHEQMWLITERTRIDGERGDTVSLIPLGGDVHVDSTDGLRWSLQDETLAFGPARGVSNEMTDDVAGVSVTSGHLLCVHTRKGWQR